MPVLVVAGEVLGDELPELPASVEVVSPVDRFGRDRSVADAAGCVEEVVRTSLPRLAR